MRRFFSLFTLLFSAILGIVYFFLGYSLASSWIEWLALAIPFLFVWSLPLFHWSSEDDETSRGRMLLLQGSYFSMGILSWLLVLTLGREIALRATYLIGGPEEFARLGQILQSPVIYLAALAFCSLGFWRAVRGPKVKEVQVPIAGLPTELQGLRIAQISDLHIGATIGRSYVEQVTSIVQKLNPDLTVLTGDIFDGNLRDHLPAAEALAALTPSQRIYFAPGNHEYYWTIDDWLGLLPRLGIKALLNQGESIDHRGHSLWIAGVTDPAGQKPLTEKAAQGSQEARLKILLSHRPDPADDAEKSGFDLQLSGHTHGGQFFPWTLVAARFHDYFLGLHRHGRMWIYVSPGTGTWGPPLRLGTTPEVTLIRIERE